MSAYCDPEFESKSALKALQAKLESTLDQKKGRSRKFENKIHNSNQLITSWKFNEWDYYKENVPCQARGLFTIGNNIAVRGYDKFFNLEEVPSTKQKALKSETSSPYELTVKENGCIVFVGGLEDGTIIVCSKHSTGAREELSRNHAIEGEEQLKRQLQTLNKSVSDLAKVLAKYNITLVMELCDDSFEEHILSYQDKEAGLYLHGINYNLIQFKTYPMEKVDLFAQEWGFKTVEHFQINDYGKLFDFLNECQKTGTWKDREIEGFVVRCKRQGNDFFFKFKFEQPYLIYRNFREVTKQHLRDKPLNEIVGKYKKEKYIIAKYHDFVVEYFHEHPEQKERYLEGHGIIALRKAFLESLGLNEISAMNLFKINEELSKADASQPDQNKYILVPIATIGCGKTAISKTLTALFDWGHIQNDDIPSKYRTKLITSSLQALQAQDLVIADKNNHQKRERRELFNALYKFKPDYLSSKYNLVVIALNFIPPGTDNNELFKATFDRVAKRGDNHQSIRHESNPDLTGKIMRGFINRFQPLNTTYDPDSDFSMTINLNYNSSVFDNVQVVLKQLQENYPDLIPKIPEDGVVNKAIEEAMSYKPEYVKTFSKPKEKKKKSPRPDGCDPAPPSQGKKTKKPAYYGVMVSDRDGLVGIIDRVAQNNNLWDLMKSLNKVQERFHVTLGHYTSSKESEQSKEKWAALQQLLKPTAEQKGPVQFVEHKCSIKLVRLVLCEKLICIQVEVADFVDGKNESVTVPTMNKHSHITIGTFKDYKPYVSNTVLNQLIDEHSETLPNDVYTLSDGLQVQVINMDEPAMPYQRLFGHY